MHMYMHMCVYTYVYVPYAREGPHDRPLITSIPQGRRTRPLENDLISLLNILGTTLKVPSWTAK